MSSKGLRVHDGVSFYVKKSVRMEGGMALTYTSRDAYTLTRTDYQEILQDLCKFSNPANIWVAINKHPRPDVIYGIWAKCSLASPNFYTLNC